MIRVDDCMKWTTAWNAWGEINYLKRWEWSELNQWWNERSEWLEFNVFIRTEMKCMSWMTWTGWHERMKYMM